MLVDLMQSIKIIQLEVCANRSGKHGLDGPCPEILQGYQSG